MSQIITGKQYQNVQDEIIDQLIADYQTNPNQEYFLLVPNHIKFATEVKVLNRLSQLENVSDVSSKNIQVLSFSRLSWLLLKKADQNVLPTLSDTAATMVLSRIIKENQSKLTLYKNTNINPGMIDQIYGAINQIENDDVDPAEFFDNHNLDLDLETKTKIADLKIIYHAFKQETATKFVTKNQASQNFNQFLAANQSLINDTNFYLTDFSYFSPLELETIKILIASAKQINFGFLLGESTTDAEYDLITKSQITKIKQFFHDQLLKFDESTVTKSLVSSDIQNLNNSWVNETSAENSALTLIKADSRYDEAYFVARTIYSLVASRDKKYRYRDFLIVAPNLNEYETYLGPILAAMNIPYFNDLQKEMKYHPLVLLLEGLSELNQENLSARALIQILKTNLFNPQNYPAAELAELTDQLENFILRFGLDHQQLKQNFLDYFEGVILTPTQLQNYQKIESFKNDVIKAITEFLEKLQKISDTNDALTIFYQFLQDNNVLKTLEKRRNQANENGELQLALEPEQVISTLESLLADYQLINPDNFAATEFFETIKNGFAVANFAQIPATLDAVTISELGMVQSHDYQQQFIIGATSSNLPNNNFASSFFNQENIEQINAQLPENSQLEDHNLINQLNDRYLFGLNLVNASEHVYLSYPQINSDNKQLKPSEYLTELANLTGQNPITQSDLPTKSAHNLLEFITTPSNSLGYLLYFNQLDPSKQVEKLINLTNEYLPAREREQLQLAYNYSNQPVTVKKELAAQLFGQKLLLSISQLESYYKNPYDYFLNYGLHLKKRSENDFDSLQTGSYYHEIFDKFVKELNRKKIDLTNFSVDDLLPILQRIEQGLKEDNKYRYYLQNAKNNFLAQKLDETANVVLLNWLEKISQTPLRPKYSEVTFGPDKDLFGPEFNVLNHPVLVRGKIDRIDAANVNNKEVVQVVDYKSSEHKFDLNSFYHGLQLQMLTYLDVLKQNPQFFNNQEIVPFGAFYQTIANNPVTYKKMTLSERAKNDYLGAFAKQLQLGGLLVNEKTVLDLITPNLDQDHKLYTGIKPKKDGTLSLPKTSFLPSELDQLFKYNDLLIKKAASDIYQGKFPLLPFQNKNQNGLTFSDYKDIMYFDVLLPGNEYNKITPAKADEIMKKISEELDDEN